MTCIQSLTGEWGGQNNLTGNSIQNKYLKSIHTSFQTLTTVGSSDTPRGTKLESILQILWMLVTIVLISATVSFLALEI